MERRKKKTTCRLVWEPTSATPCKCFFAALMPQQKARADKYDRSICCWMTTSHRRNSCPGLETLHIFLFGERRWGREEKGERKEKKRKKKVSLLSARRRPFLEWRPGEWLGGFAVWKAARREGRGNLDRPLCRINFAAEGVCRRCQRALRRRSGPSDAFWIWQLNT